MGIVSSTFASLAIQLAWNCQRLLDPQYRCVEGKKNASEEYSLTTVAKNRLLQMQREAIMKENDFSSESKMNNFNTNSKMNNRILEKRKSSSSSSSSSSASSSSSSTNLKLSLDVKGRRSTMRRQRYTNKKRPASFDTALIIHRSDNTNNRHGSRCSSSNQLISNCVTISSPCKNSSPSAAGALRPLPQFWDVTSSSGCSSDSGSYLDSDSEIEDRLNEAFIEKKKYHEMGGEDEEEELEENDDKSIKMSADEEAAFRMTVGRGHFSRSKKDRFLNHLRLEKRLNGLNNNNFYGTTNHIGHGRNKLTRRYSGDLYRVTY